MPKPNDPFDFAVFKDAISQLRLFVCFYEDDKRAIGERVFDNLFSRIEQIVEERGLDKLVFTKAVENYMDYLNSEVDAAFYEAGLE